MKQIFPLFLTLLIVSCSKSSPNNSTTSSAKTFGYSVWCSKGTWSGEYVDERNDETQVINGISGWSYTGTIPLGGQANLSFSSDLAGDFDTTTIYSIGTVYVNGKAVKIDTVKSNGGGHTAQTDGQIIYTIN